MADTDADHLPNNFWDIVDEALIARSMTLHYHPEVRDFYSWRYIQLRAKATRIIAEAKVVFGDAND